MSISSYKLFYLTVDKGLPPERVDQWQQQRADLVAGARLASAAGNGSRWVQHQHSKLRFIGH